jgi:hydroxymethylpyrimidine/phosphomethylpyrimidine kinase
VALGARAVLLKGGHATGKQNAGRSDDLFFDGERREWLTLPAPRIVTRNTHGTGCTLSSAITAGLARGLPLRQAVVLAKRYLHEALQAGAHLSIVRKGEITSDYAAGSMPASGHGPVHHFYALWPRFPPTEK